MSAHRPNHVLFCAVSLSLLICGGLLLYGAGRGLDLTDEIFYLVWARNPDAYALIYQPFGYLLHPLLMAVGGDLHWYRLSGFAIAATSGASLGASLAPDYHRRPLFALQGATCALTIFFPWIITPSYNSAANVAALLLVSSLVLASKSRPVATALLGGSGLCVAAFAKPPLCAIAAGIMLVAAVKTTHRRTRLALIVAPLLGMAAMSLFLAPAEAVGLIRRMAATQHILALPNTPAGLPAKILRDTAAVPPLLIAAAVAAVASFVLGRSRWFIWPGYAAVSLSLCYVASIAADAIDGEIPDYIGLSLVLAVAGYAGVLQGQWRLGALCIASLIAAPFAVALGTFNNHWAQLNFSMCFPLLALFVLASADPVVVRRGFFFTFSVVAPPILMVMAAFAPYSLPASIFDQQIPIEHPVTHSLVRVDQETAAFVQLARGHVQGALLVDLSGTGPGVAAVLGGRAPTLLWLNPATPTWPDVVWSRLSNADRESAWFIGPVWPLFRATAAARWLEDHKRHFCQEFLPETPFWGVERRLIVWRPCARARRLAD